MSGVDLVAVGVERRRVAVAAFAGLRLEYIQVRELSADEDEAGRSTARFIAWALDMLRPDQVAVEVLPSTRATRRLYLHAMVRGTLLRHRAAVVDVEPQAMRQALAAPRFATDAQARAAANQLFSELDRYPDQIAPRRAALIGLHVQMSRLFSDQ